MKVEIGKETEAMCLKSDYKDGSWNLRERKA